MSPPTRPPDQGTTWTDKFGRVRNSQQEFHHDDGRITYGQEAIRDGCDWIDRLQAKRQHATAARAPRVVAIVKPRTTGGRESHGTRPGHRRTRTAQTGTSSSDDDGPAADPPAEGDLRHISIPLADELARIADRHRANAGVG